MTTILLATFLAEVADRAQITGVADWPVETLRNPGDRRTPGKRLLLARAAAGDTGSGTTVISHF